MNKYLSILLTPVLLIFLTNCSTQKTSTEENIAEQSTYPKVSFEQPPNILWLVTEDLSPYLASFGDSTVYKYTPNLNRLTEEGITFTNTYSPSGVCAPSRFAIATGMYPSSMGGNHMRTTGNSYFDELGIIPYDVVTPPGVKMMSEILREHGYYTSNNAKNDYQFHATKTAWDENGRDAHYKHRAEGQPFFAIFNFEVTHESRIWVKAEDSLYIPEDLEVPIPPYLPDTEVAVKDIRRMYSNIVEMDVQIGEKIKELEEAGLLDNTIIFWYGDHGGPLPRQKRLLYDSGMQLPLIIRFPDGTQANTLDDRLISFIDFAPTTFSLAGIKPPDYLQGQAFLGEYTAKPRKYVHGAADRFDGKYDMIRAVRDKRFKYLKNFKPDQPYYLPVTYREQMPIMQELLRLNKEGKLNEIQSQWFRQTKDEEELFDCDNDPYELHNLANDPKYADKLAELRTECERWMKATDDKGFMPEKELIESFWPNMMQPVTAQASYQIANNELNLSVATEGASIGYQFVEPGTEPTDKWQVYTKAVSIPENKNIYLITDRIGYAPSEPVKVDLNEN
ncbi:MAG: sulfatase [Thalassobius sp.]|nr:sulfatase [Thalassovita sp.]